jgi:hypothetical protein
MAVTAIANDEKETTIFMNSKEDTKVILGRCAASLFRLIRAGEC